MKLRKLYLPPKSTFVSVEAERGYLLVDSGKSALSIAPIEAEVDPFVEEDETIKDFGEISFL